ncbi:hypothetical protein [Tengunoibacter tsumagoiensis]|uniref:Uncharacterized protein n=1 Tax=Tengunoibacter tsumagoiensis TaxID=2014871 RepID=A0A401ZZW8_9CHLR|nr:hypothetical protein [Tengunoibacter tsumagoiensis]GCE12369.1 hypothetical protein KTT_22280 [Tengunoibacter tsumagoiensis]
MQFPYNRYQTLAEPLPVTYPAGAESLARLVSQTVSQANQKLTQLLQLAPPELDLLVVDMSDWHLAPHEEDEEVEAPHPYLTQVTPRLTLVVPVEFDALFGEMVPEKVAFMLYHEVALAFIEADPRPWPENNPLWADEWQFKFAALWLAREINGVQDVVNQDLFTEYEDLFEPEPDGKTPDTVRGFDWYADTTPEDYLGYELLLERFAADLLTKYGVKILPSFLTLYRQEREELLSDDVTAILSSVLGPDGNEWLEELIYF